MKPDLKQASTWRGILGLAAMAGIVINPQWLEIIALVLGTGFSVIEIIRDEK